MSFKFSKKNLREAAEELDGKTVTAIAERARKYGTYATAPIQRRCGDEVRNSVVLLDRNGERVGVYDKVHPVLMSDGSLEYGITPAAEFPVFDLDFGRVGIQICWDVAFDDGWRAYGNQDAELVVFCTNPAVRTALRGYAWRHGYYIAASAVHPPSLIVDPIGRVVGSTSSVGEIIVSQIDLDYRVLHSNCMWEWTEERAEKYKGRINIEWDVEAHMYLATSLDRYLPMRKFLEQEDLLTGRQRNGRNIELQMEGRGGPPKVPASIERE